MCLDYDTWVMVLRGWTVVTAHIGPGLQDLPLHLRSQAGGQNGEAYRQEGCDNICAAVDHLVWSCHSCDIHQLIDKVSTQVSSLGYISSVRYLEAKVALAFRGRLTQEAHRRYMSNQTYYRVSNLDGRLDNPDHCLTDDISSFTSACAHLYSHVSKPILDATTVSFSLIRVSIG